MLTLPTMAILNYEKWQMLRFLLQRLAIDVTRFSRQWVVYFILTQFD